LPAHTPPTPAKKSSHLVVHAGEVLVEVLHPRIERQCVNNARRLASRAAHGYEATHGAAMAAFAKSLGERDETKFFDARNRAETELPYGSKPSSTLG
jgi:hypothetical protein